MDTFKARMLLFPSTGAVANIYQPASWPRIDAQLTFVIRQLNIQPFGKHPKNSEISENQKYPKAAIQDGGIQRTRDLCGSSTFAFDGRPVAAAAYLLWRTVAASHNHLQFWPHNKTIVEHNLNSKIWNNGYGNRNCNVQWRKVVFLGTRRSSLEAANGPRQRCGSFSATCEMEDFLIKLKYHAPFDPISVFQYKLCLNKFPKGQQKDIQCCCFVE